MAPEPTTEQVIREPPSAFGDVGPRQAQVAEHETFGVGTRVADRFEDFGEAEFGTGEVRDSTRGNAARCQA